MWHTLKPHFTIIKVKINMKDEWSSARGLLEFHRGQILCAVLSRSVVSNSLQPQGPWAARPSSRGSSQLRDRTQVSCIAGIFLTI